MFPSIPVLWLCLFVWRLRAQAASPSAAFEFPVSDGLIINTIDTVVLQWKSNYKEAWMQMWCQNGAIGNNVVLGSTSSVNSTGTYPYVISSDAPALESFPVACHARLVDAPVNGNGVDSPVGVTFVSLSGTDAPAKTFSLVKKDAETIGVTTTLTPITSSGSPTSTTSSASSGTKTESERLSSTQNSSSSFTTSVTPAPIPPPTSTPPAPNPPSKKARLSTGIIVVIAIVSVIVVFSIAGFAFWYRGRKNSSPNPGPAVPELEGKADLGPYGAANYGRHELEDEARRRFEMAAERDRPEMEGGVVRYELSAGSPKPRVAEMF